MYLTNFIYKTIGRVSYHSANETQAPLDWKGVLMLPEMFNPNKFFVN